MSFIIPRSSGGTYVIGLGQTLSSLDWDSASTKVLCEVDQGKETRFNDAKCDASGRLWAGIHSNYSLYYAPCWKHDLQYWVPVVCVLPSVLWHYLLGVRKSIRPIKKLTYEALAWLSVWSKVQMICIRSSWCQRHPKISYFIKIHIGLTFLVLEKRPSNRCLSVSTSWTLWQGFLWQNAVVSVILWIFAFAYCFDFLFFCELHTATRLWNAWNLLVSLHHSVCHLSMDFCKTSGRFSPWQKELRITF